MTAGVRLAVDVGTVRMGVAVSDPDGMVAVPMDAVLRGTSDVDDLAELVQERGAVEVVVGLPRTLAGRSGPSVAMAEEYAARLAARIDPVPIRFVDGRLTTAAAERQQRETRARRSPKKGARDRASGRLDSLAAAGILQTYLDGLPRKDAT